MKYNKILISIIVPIYNVKTYLDKCIQSIQNQTYKNLEIILVDDGSTDGSEIICDNYAQEDRRIKVIHKKNGGITSARKAGVNISTGSYIGFVDGDDWIDANMYEMLLQEAFINDVQIVLSDMYRHKFTGEVTIWKSRLPAGVYYINSLQGREIIKNLFSGINSLNNGISGGVHVKLFERQLLIKHINKVDDRIRGFADDKVIVYSALLEAKKICVLDKAFYHGIDRKDSATHSKNIKFFEQLQLVYDHFKNTFESYSMCECLIKQLHQFVMLSAISNINSLANDILVPEYYMTHLEKIQGKKIVLYGAGKVGKSFHIQMNAEKFANIVLWVDKFPDINKGISPIEDIKKIKYDYIIVAVREKMLFENIYYSLINWGIENEKIVWISPVHITEYYAN